MKKNFIGIALLSLWGIFLTACVYGYLQYLQPARLTPLLEGTLENALGVDISVDSAEVSIFPTFSLRLENVQLLPSLEKKSRMATDTVQVSLQATSLEMALGWLSLLRFEPVIADIWLEQPEITVSLKEKPVVAPAALPAVAVDIAPKEQETTPQLSPASHSLAEVEQKTKKNSKKEPLLPPALQDTRLHLFDASIAFTSQKNNAQVLVEGITGSARLPGFFSGRLDLRIARTTCQIPALPRMEFQDFFLQLVDVEFEKGERSPKISGEIAAGLSFQMESFSTVREKPVAPAFDYFPLAEPVHLRLDATGRMENGTYDAEGAFSATGGLMMNTMFTPLALAIPFRIEQGKPMALEKVALAFGPDRASFSGAVYGIFENLVLPDKTAALQQKNPPPAEKEQGTATSVEQETEQKPAPEKQTAALPMLTPPSLTNPVLRGQVETDHFSLTYWFGFARSMLPGLQIALDHIEAKGELELDKRGLYAKNVKANILDMPFTLACNLQNFSNPHLEFFISADKANLDPLFPEFRGEVLTPPSYPPPPVPLSESKEPSTFNFGLHISAQSIEFMRLKAEKVYCYIGASRGQTEEISQKGSFLSVRVGKVYEGMAEALVTLDKTVNIRATLTNIQLNQPLEILAGYKMFGGVASAKGTVNFSSGKIYTILNTLNANVDGKLEKGYFGSKNNTLTPYDSLAFNLKLKAQPSSAEELPATLGMGGNWKFDLQMPQLALVVDSNATVNYNTKKVMPLSMKPQKASVQLTLKKAGLGMESWTQDMKIQGTALTAFDLEKETLNLTDIQAALSNPNGATSIKGELAVSKLFSGPEFKGYMRGNTGTLNAQLATVGLTFPLLEEPTALTMLDFETEYLYAGQTLTLEKAKGRLDANPFSGNGRIEFGKRRQVQAVIRFDNFPFDHYFPASPKQVASAGPKGAPKEPSPVPLEFLRENDATLDLRFNNATLLKSPLKELHVPVSLKQANLRVGPFSATLPGGGSLNGELVSNATGNMLDSHLQLALVQVQLLPISEARKQDTILAGKAAARFNLTALFNDWNAMFSSLNGPWSIELVDGYMQSAKDSQIPEPPVTYNPHTAGHTTPPTSGGAKTIIAQASASGTITNGLVACDNLLIKGPLLSIRGGGQVNLGTEEIKAKVIATLFGIPEVPVEISGTLRDPQLSYKVAGAVAGTIGNLGGTVIGIVGGVVSAPFKLLFGSGEKKQDKPDPDAIFQNPPLPIH